MRRALFVFALITALIVGPAEVSGGQTPVSSDVETQALRSLAARIPPGTRVKAQTVSGRGVTGTLMSADADAVVIKKRTRVPEPAVSIPYAELARIEIDKQGGMSIAKIIGVGLSAGAGAMLAVIAIVAAVGD